MSEYTPLILIKLNGELIKGQETPCGKCVNFRVDKFYPNRNEIPEIGICGFREGMCKTEVPRDISVGVMCPLWMRNHKIDCITIQYQQKLWVAKSCKCCGQKIETPYIMVEIRYFNGNVMGTGLYKEDD